MIDWTSLAMIFGAALGIVLTLIQRRHSATLNETMLNHTKETLMLVENLSERITENGDMVSASLDVAGWPGNGDSDS